MCGRKEDLKAREVEEMMFSSSQAYRRKAIVKRRLMSRNCRITDEEVDSLIEQEAFVKADFRHYMYEEMIEIQNHVYEIERMGGRREKRKRIERLLDDLKLLLPDLIEMLK